MTPEIKKLTDYLDAEIIKEDESLKKLAQEVDCSVFNMYAGRLPALKHIRKWIQENIIETGRVERV